MSTLRFTLLATLSSWSESYLQILHRFSEFWSLITLQRVLKYIPGISGTGHYNSSGNAYDNKNKNSKKFLKKAQWKGITVRMGRTVLDKG